MVKGPHPEDVTLIVDYLSGQMRKLGVKIKLGQEADAAMIQAMNPDVVFVATGAQQTIPEIKGIDHRKVVAGGDLHNMLKFYSRFLTPYTLRSLSKLYMPKIGKNVIVIGGALQGCELAEFLAKRGRNVTIVEKADELGEAMVPALWGYLKIWFNKNGVKMLTGVKEYVGIDDRGLTIVGRDGIKVTLKADTFVSALPLTPKPDLVAELEGKVPEVYAVGDCVQPGLIREAINAGLQTAIAV
jgi:2,4-dienoyl-CoA reductase (NADPH2)